MRKVVAACLRFYVIGQVFRERDQGLTGDVAAFDVAKIAVLNRLQNLSLSAKNRVFRFRDVTIDDRGEGGIFFSLEPAGAFKLGLAFDDPGVGGLFSVKCLRLSGDDLAALFDDDLGRIGLRVVFASPYYYAAQGTT